jgi:transcriptional regulator with XRE-family HTH domain
MQDNLKIRIGIAVRHARSNADLSQEELANRIGKSAEAVSNIERGLALPTIETLLSLASVLGVPLLELIGEPELDEAKSKHRIALECQLDAAAQRLDDRVLEVAILQMEVLAKLGDY